MISLWPHWIRPYFLLALPLLVLVIWIIWRAQHLNSPWIKFIPKFFQKWLLTNPSYSKESALPKLILTAALLSGFIALLGPSWEKQSVQPIKYNSDLVVVLDLSDNINAKDLPPDRLTVAKRKITDLLKLREHNRTGLVVYAKTAHTVVPLTEDPQVIQNMLTAVNPTIMPLQGNQAQLGIDEALTLLGANNSNNGTPSSIGGSILLITGNLTLDEQQKIRTQMAHYPNVKLNILGIGVDGQNTPLQNEQGFIRDEFGQIKNSYLNNQKLAELATSLGGSYHTVTLNDLDLLSFEESRPELVKQTLTNQMAEVEQWKDQGYWFILPFVLLLALGARRGWLFCLPFVLYLNAVPTAQASQLDHILYNQNQVAHKALQQEQYDEAIETFDRDDWRAYANYLNGDYQAAEAYYKNDSSIEGLYNYGNALAQQGKYQQALDAWDKAIERRPNFEQAIKNRDLVRKLLEEQNKEDNQDNQNNQNDDKSQDDKQNNNDDQNQNDKQDQNGENNQDDQQNQNDEQNQDDQQNQNGEQNQDDQQNQNGEQNQNDQQNQNGEQNQDDQQSQNGEQNQNDKQNQDGEQNQNDQQTQQSAQASNDEQSQNNQKNQSGSKNPSQPQKQGSEQNREPSQEEDETNQSQLDDSTSSQGQNDEQTEALNQMINETQQQSLKPSAQQDEQNSDDKEDPVAAQQRALEREQRQLLEQQLQLVPDVPRDLSDLLRDKFKREARKSGYY